MLELNAEKFGKPLFCKWRPPSTRDWLPFVLTQIMSDSEPEIGEISEEDITSSEDEDEEEVAASPEVPNNDSDMEDAGGGDATVPIFAVWMNIVGEDAGLPPLQFTAAPGPNRVLLPQDATPLQYVQLFLTDTFIDMIVRETNRYADKWVETHQEYLRQKPKSRVHDWIKQGHTTKEEVKASLALVMKLGINPKKMITLYWDVSHPSQSSPWFVQHFNRDRFQIMLKFLHFADNDQMPEPGSPDFKLYKIKSVVDHMKAQFLKYYVPHANVSIDESMIGYRGKTPHLRQYMPNKHHSRFGIKVWCVCDSQTHYTSNVEIFKGAHEGEDIATAEGATYALVFRLMRETNLLYQGYHLACDNYFSSPKLFLDLFQQKTLATETVRSNRKGLPKQMLKETLNNGQVSERRRGPLLCVAYKDNTKRLVLWSTKTAGGFRTTRNSKGKELVKPKCVVAYNASMGGVDTSDARLYAYLSERRTMK